MPEHSTQPASSEQVCELTVSNKMGIHARPAAMIVRAAAKYSGDVWVVKDQEQVNGKSIMGLMMLAAGPGSKVTFTATGSDASALFAELRGLFEKKFDES